MVCKANQESVKCFCLQLALPSDKAVVDLQLQCRTRLLLPQHRTHERAFARSTFSKQQHEKHSTLLVSSHSDRAEWKLRPGSKARLLFRYNKAFTSLNGTAETPHRYFTQNRLKTDRLCVWFAFLKTCSSLFIPNKLQQTAIILQSKMWHGSWQGFLQGKFRYSVICSYNVHLRYSKLFWVATKEVKLIELWTRLNMNSQTGR